MVENEIQFLSSDEFRRMAPPILQLEITRLGELIGAAGSDLDFRNALVRARHALRQFVACLEAEAAFDDASAEHLRVAALSLAFDPAERDEQAMATLAYVRDRVRYVHDRLPLLY